MDSDDEFMSGLSDDGFEQVQDSDDGSIADGPFVPRLACVYCLIGQADMTPTRRRIRRGCRILPRQRPEARQKGIRGRV